MNRKSIFIFLFILSCFKNSLIDRISEDYFPLHEGFRTKFLHLPSKDTAFIEIMRDTVILGEECKVSSFFGELKFFKKDNDYIREYFKEVFYTGEEKYTIEESFIPFIPSIFVDGENIEDSLKRMLIVEGDTLWYERNLKIQVNGPVSFRIGDVEFENCFEVRRVFKIWVKKGVSGYEKTDLFYEVYTPLKGLIFYASSQDTFKYIGGR